MSEAKHTPGPWTWRDSKGAGLQISATLPEGFQFDGTARGADGETSFMIWTVREAYTVQIADERWVQFSTGSWLEMQEANARLIAAAPDLLAACNEFVRKVDAGEARSTRSYQQMKAAIAKAEGESLSSRNDTSTKETEMNFPKNLYVRIDGEKPDEFFNASDEAAALSEFGEKIKIATYQLVTVQTGELIAKFSPLPAKKRR